MNRNQRNYKYRRPKSRTDKRKQHVPGEVIVARVRRPMQSRCCYITPNQPSFAQLINSQLTESTSQCQSLVGFESRRPPRPVLNTIEEPARPKSPEIITIASPKQPKVNDMPAKPKIKRSYQRSFYGRKQAQLDIKSYASSQAVADSSTDPYISKPGLNSDKENSPLPGVTMAQINELRKIFFPASLNVEKASQYEISYEEMTKWRNIDNSDEIDKIILKGRDEETLTPYHNLPKNLRICEVPRIKLLAEKFNKYKKENVEVRRLEEKVVCVEYDVFDREEETAPVQRIRAFFSIKPTATGNGDENLTELPSTIRNKFNISTDDLQKLNQKQIEILDGKILENRPYLDDLRKLLRRRENAQHNKTTLNLQALYEMGKRDLLDFDSNFDSNVMPKDELQTMKNIILKYCKSSVHGVRRRTLENNSEIYEDMVQNKMSRSLVTELLRESNKTFTDL